MTRNYKPWEHVISVSGGKDSTATLLLAVERRDAKGRDFQAAFADTGHEHEWTISFIEKLAAHTGVKIRTVRADFTERLAQRRRYIEKHWARKGVPAAKIEQALELMRPTGIPFLDLVLWKNRFPSSQRRFCTEELKVIPLIEQVYRPIWDEGRAVVSWQGIRADESLARSMLDPWQRLEIENGGRTYAYRPILRWTREDVFAMHKRHGLDPNPLYAAGFGRVGCMVCINVQKEEMRLAAQRFPEHVEKIAAWERLVAEVSQRDAATFFPNTSILEKVEWSKTTYGGKQYDLLGAIEFNTPCHEWGACEPPEDE